VSPCPSPNTSISAAFAEHDGDILLHLLLHLLLHILLHLFLHLLYLHMDLRPLCLLCGKLIQKSRGSRRKWPVSNVMAGDMHRWE
jgi:hypothetical protein